MAKLVTITPNPTLDLGGCVESLIPDEKNYVIDETRYPGGNGINAARLASRLGADVIATGFMGRGVGDEVLDLLKAEELACDFVPIHGHTRISLTVTNQETHRQTRLSFAGPRLTEAEIKQLKVKVENLSSKSAIVLVGGSFPPNFETHRIRQWMDEWKNCGFQCAVDVPGKLLKDLINSDILFAKPNLSEFNALIGKELKSCSEIRKEVESWERSPQWLCVSSVEGGALLIHKDQAWFGVIPKVKVQTSVGAGDSMVAAMLTQLSEGVDEGGELLRWGLAAATATLIVEGTELGDAEKVKEFLSQVKIEKL